MPDPSGRTRYHHWSPRSAVIVLCLTLIATIACAWSGGASHAILQNPIPKGMLSDTDVLILITQRVHHGENYYDAAADELRANRYGIRSIFNWRQPIYAWILGALPDLKWGRVLLAALGVFAIVLASLPLFHDGPLGGLLWITLLSVWLLGSALFYCFVPWGVVTIEAWAGVLIVLSVFAYADGFWPLGMLIGLLALFFRELSAPYILVCIWMAYQSSRWREIVAWCAGLVLYAVYFCYHVIEVHRHMRPTDLGYAEGWIQFGGLHFVVSTASPTALLSHFPLWVAGIFLPLSLLGLFGLPRDFGRRAAWTVSLYLLLFAVVGKPFNDYWGFMYSPLLAFGLPWLGPSLIDLRNALMAKQVVPARSISPAYIKSD